MAPYQVGAFNKYGKPGYTVGLSNVGPHSDHDNRKKIKIYKLLILVKACKCKQLLSNISVDEMLAQCPRFAETFKHLTLAQHWANCNFQTVKVGPTEYC